MSFMFSAKLFRRSMCARCGQSVAQQRSYSATPRLFVADESRLPRVANPAFWSSMIPRPLRRNKNAQRVTQTAGVKDEAYQEKRTAIGFLILGILVGSNAINLLSLRREMVNFSRQTDAKLELLREIIQKVKNGEAVDVRRVLGTGDEKAEEEWEQVMKELETTDMLAEGRKKREQRRREKSDERVAKEKEAHNEDDTARVDATDSSKSSSRPKFLV